MDCKDLQKDGLLNDLVLGEVSGDERLKAIEHINTCAACKAERDALGGIVNALKGAWPHPAMTGGERIAEGVIRGARATKNSKKTAVPSAAFRWRKLFAPAATAAVFIFFFAGIRWMIRDVVTAPAAVSRTAQMKTPRPPAPHLTEARIVDMRLTVEQGAAMETYSASGSGGVYDGLAELDSKGLDDMRVRLGQLEGSGFH
ncbi:MAG: zf-HC2 domain-containing protein [Deltaproteobacteria bacterium]|nr:zf-HC2 domain-containing protein [Deltaproteobacteria bacterium]